MVFPLKPITEADTTKLVEFIQKSKPDIIGISVQSTVYQTAIRISKIIKKETNSVLVWGGQHCTVATDECTDYADYVFSGESIETFLEFIDVIEKKGGIDSTEDITSAIAESEKVYKPKNVFNELDSLPFLDITSDGKYYLEDGRILSNGKSLFLPGCMDTPYKTLHTTMTSWGCPFKCTYCINSVKRAKVRRRSVNHVIEELTEVKNTNPHLLLIFFYDDIFTMDLDWCKEFAKRYKSEIDIPFWCYTHPKFTKKEVLEVLRRAGLCIVVMGIQTISDKTRKILGRSEKNKDVISACTIISDLRDIPLLSANRDLGRILLPMYDLITKNPLENREELSQTINLLCDLPKNFLLNQFALTHFPNYPLTNYLLEKNLITTDIIEGKQKLNKKEMWDFLDFETNINYKADDTDSKMHIFYYLLFSLTQYSVFPRWIIKKISKSSFFENHPGFLLTITRIARLISIIYNFKTFIKMGRLMKTDLEQKVDKLCNEEKPIPKPIKN